MKPPYKSAPATPGEHADPAINPSGGDMGWIVVDSEDVAFTSFGDGYMCEHVAAARAIALNQSRAATSVVNDCACMGFDA